MSVAVPWDEFIRDQLLHYGFVNGVAVLTENCMCAYSYGMLGNLDESTWQQFVNIFKYSSKKHDVDIYENGFNITLSGGKQVKYTVYQKTFSSVYATSEGNDEGLAVCYIPNGVFIASYSHPTVAAQAVKVVERFCDLLR